MLFLRLAVLAFPCNSFGGQEPGSPEDILAFATKTKQAKFDLFRKVEVNGASAHPVFKWLLDGESSECSDDESSCAAWASQGECDANPEFMKVTPEMGAGKISVADARRLKAGDVIVLETHPDELAVVHVDDKPKYLGYACRSKHGKNSVKVVGLVPASEQEKYRNRC